MSQHVFSPFRWIWTQSRNPSLPCWDAALKTQLKKGMTEEMVPNAGLSVTNI